MRTLPAFLLLLSLVACGGGVSSSFTDLNARQTVLAQPFPAGKDQIPVRITVPDGSQMERCPDPSIIRSQSSGDTAWYLYCTNEMFTSHGPLHLMAISKSQDLVNWTYVGDVFQRMPSWVGSGGWLWAPDIEFFNGKYYLYYAVSNTSTGGSGIFVATSDSPAGPWNATPTPVVEPEPSPCCSGGMRDTIDPVILDDGNQKYIFYGSFNGGIAARPLSTDGMSTDRSSTVQISPANRYEAPYFVKHGGYYYIFLSAGNCCSGPLSGYGVFAARSTSPLGPYLDKDGRSISDSRVGGTPVLAMNGNRWIGPGHHAVVTEMAGQDWMVYHAIDMGSPFFDGAWTKRPVLIDPIDWIDGWPRVRAGTGPSDSLQSAPIVQEGQTTAPSTPSYSLESPGLPLPNLSDEFTGSTLSPQWKWIRQPASAVYGFANGQFRFDTQSGELFAGKQTASVLTEPVPGGDFMVEVKFSNTVPLQGHHNFSQGGIVIFKDDVNYLKLAVSAINDTRQIEFAKQYVPGTYPMYGSTFLASPGDDTYLRIVKRTANGQERYTAYSSHDGVEWERGGTWTHSLGANAKIGLVSMSGAGFTSYFDYVHVYSMK